MTDIRLRAAVIIVSAISAIVIIRMSRKAKMEIQDAINWFIVCMIFVLVSLFPEVIVLLASFLGMQMPSNAVFLIAIFVLLCIVYYLNIRISKLSMQIRELVQSLAMLENKIRTERSQADGKK